MKGIKLSKRKVSVSNLNSRVEKHGEVNAPAYDISMEVIVSKKDINDLVATPTPFCDLVFSEGGALHIFNLMPLTIHRDADRHEVILTDEEGDIVFEQAKISGLTLDLIDGWKGTLKFKAKVAINPEKDGERREDIARLAYLQKGFGKVKIKPMDADLFDDKDDEESDDDE